MISSSSTTPATLNRLASCSNPRILKLLPSYCNFALLCLADELSRSCRPDQASGLIGPASAANLIGSGILPSQQVLQECGKRLAALGSHRRNFHELIGRPVRMFQVGYNRIAA